jgi:heavy metal translocating P-type ATPase
LLGAFFVEISLDLKYYVTMKNPGELLIEELEEEKKSLKINATLTAVTLAGLLFGIYLQIIDGAAIYIGAAFLLAYLAGGIPAARGAFAELLKGKLDIDLLMVLAALAAAGVGEARDGAILLFLFSLAGTLEEYAMGNTKRAVVALMKLRPDEANLEGADGQLSRVSVESLKLDQIVVIKPGEKIPVDGTIESGVSAVDQSSMTGESVPVDKDAGDTVFAGTVNGHGVLRVKVGKLSSHSTLAQMIKLVTEAQEKRSPSERFSDWFGERYTILVLVGSVLALGGFILFGLPYEDAFYKAATLLVVASPCAIVISVPAAILSALAASARKGMLFKGGAALETFAQVDIVAFDKTGTLTEGKMKVNKVVPIGVSEHQLMQLAASLEANSEHPLAKSILNHAEVLGIYPAVVEKAEAVPGKGVYVTQNGRRYFAGNRKMLAETGIKIDRKTEMALSELESEGMTSIIIGSDVVLGVIGISDTIRASAKETIAALRKSGIKRIVMLTGDHTSVANAVGREIGILPEDIYAELMPIDKVTMVEKLRSEGNVSFVGDGVNDAAALATSHVGVAMGTAGSDVALEAADVALLSDDLQALMRARNVSTQANRIIKQNLVFAIGILSIMVVMTLFTDKLTLPLGVLGHEGGTLLVVANGLRILWQKF